jgi:thioredoxin 1
MATGIVETTDDNFEGEVLKAAHPVLVDFWAPWCGPCRALAPTIEKFATETSGKVKVVKHNTQDHEGTPSRYGVSAIPTLLVFHQGKEVHRLVGGGRSLDELKRVFEKHAGVKF